MPDHLEPTELAGFVYFDEICYLDGVPVLVEYKNRRKCFIRVPLKSDMLAAPRVRHRKVFDKRPGKGLD